MRIPDPQREWPAGNTGKDVNMRKMNGRTIMHEPRRRLRLGEAILLASQRGHLPRIAISEESLLEVDQLERAYNAASVLGNLTRSLAALGAYAADSAHRNGDFWHWCRHSGHPRALSWHNVAATESETVRKRTSLRSERWFWVDPRLSEWGRIVMMSHIKLGRGQYAPRLYFHDDTRGLTGQVHIGYIGPHLPTAHAA